MKPWQLSEELRHGAGEDLRRRRGLVGLALLGCGAMGVVALYQTGIIRHVPEPKLPWLDADRVDASDEAYSHASTPDGLLGLRNYGTTAVLAAMGGADRASRRPWIPLALAAKVLFDAAVAAKLSWDQWSKHRAFCSWCLLSGAAAVAMLPLAFPEAREALRVVARRSEAVREAPTRAGRWKHMLGIG